jgi:hypothetical protein
MRHLLSKTADQRYVKQMTMTQPNELLIDFTVHNLPVEVLNEFATTIVKPYYLGNLKAAIVDLMEKAIVEQDFIQKHVRASELNVADKAENMFSPNKEP